MNQIPIPTTDPFREGNDAVPAEVTRRDYLRITVSAKHWWGLRRQWRQSLPDRVDAGSLQSSLGVSKRHARSLVSQLRVLGLIDESGPPSELAIQWLGDAGYPRACR